MSSSNTPQLSTSKQTSRAISSGITFKLSTRERTYVRFVTIHGWRNKERVNRKILRKAIIDANNGDEKAYNTDKYYSALHTKKNCRIKPSSEYQYVPHAFGTKVVKGAVVGDIRRRFKQHLDRVVSRGKERNMSETLKCSDSSLYFLDSPHQIIKDVIRKIADEYLKFELKEDVRDAFRHLLAAHKLPFVVSYLTYEIGKECGLVEHQDVDSIMFSAVLIIKDTTRGRLHIPGVALPEWFEPGDLIFMDPRVVHSVTKFARDEERQVVVFTF